jgi:hypothetical protein
MSHPYFVTWVECLWDIFFHQQCAYTVFSLIPLLTTTIQGFYLKHEGDSESHANRSLAGLQLGAGICLLIYEAFQFIQSGTKYLCSSNNAIDVLSVGGYIGASVYYLVGSDETTLITVLLASLLTGYLKLCGNIKVLTKVSYLSYTISYIISGILPFCFIFLLVVLLASMMFYVPQYFQEDGVWPNHGYWTYLLYAYDYSFGNWPDFGDKKNFQYMLLFH